MSDVLSVLSAAGKMSADMVERVAQYIKENKFDPNAPVPSAVKPQVLALVTYSFKTFSHLLVGPIFGDRLKERFLKP